MKKTLNIGSNDVAFECTSVTPIFYKNEFRKDFFADLIKLAKALNGADDFTKLTYEDLDKVDFDVIGRMAWACSKTADTSNTPSYMEWLVENPDFSVFTHGIQIAELVMLGLSPKKK